MPYIKKSQRKDLDDAIAKLLFALREAENSDRDAKGLYNYTITRLSHDYVNYHGLNYSSINDVVGILESAKNEFYRKVAAPYEDKKIKENGDVSLSPRLYSRHTYKAPPKKSIIKSIKDRFIKNKEDLQETESDEDVPLGI
jgi:hypothetical protein